MNNFFQAIPLSFDLSINYLFITGVLIIIFGSAIGILPPKFRIKTNSIWLVPTFILFGLARIIGASDLYVHSSWHSIIYLPLKLFSVLCSLEFVRRGCNTNFKKNLSPFIHVPVAVFFSIFLTMSQINSLILLEVIYFTIKAVTIFIFHSYLKILYNPTNLKSAILYLSTFICITIQAFFHFYLEVPNLFENFHSEVLFIHIAQLETIIIGLLIITMLIIRYKFVANNMPGNIRYFKPAISFILCLCAFSTGIFGLKACNTAHSQIIQNLSNVVEKASIRLSKNLNERIEFVTTSASIMSHIPNVIQYFKTNEPSHLKAVNDFLRSFNATNPNTLCLLYDINGNLKAASHDFEGLSKYNYSFRNYFKQAMKGISSISFEKGLYTSITGFFGACPIKEPETNKIIGVAVVKRNLAVEEDIFKDYAPAFLIDLSGNIIMASSNRFIGSNVTLPDNDLHTPISITNKMLSQLPGFNRDYLFGTEILNGNVWKILILRSHIENAAYYPHFLITTTIVLIIMSIMLGIAYNNEFMHNYEATQKQFKLLFDYAPDSVFIVSAKTNKIITANNQMETLFAMPAGLQEIDYNEILADSSKYSGTNNSGADIFRQECTFKKFNGEEFIGEITRSEVTFDDEKAWMIIIHDISEHKELESRLLTANQIKTRFFANASHEIRTPMTAIIGLSELALSINTNEKTKHIIGLIKTAANSMLNLVNDLLDISKIETGKFSINLKTFNINTLIKNITEIIKYSSEDKTDKIDVFISEKIPDYIISDPARIHQIIKNIIDYIILNKKSDNKIIIKVNKLIDKNLENGFNIEFSIASDFSKLSKEEQQNLFDSFIYDNPYTKEKEGLTGINLSVTKQLVDRLKGHINLTKTEDNLTAFNVSIPVFIATSNLEEKEKNKESDLNEIKLIKNGTPMNFAVADDNEINAFIAASIIKKYGGNATTVYNGEDLLKLINTNQETNYSCLLIDIQMPKLDGLETIKTIRKLKSDISTVPIIAISAFASEQEGIKAKEAGANDYLGKPYYPENLINMILKLIEKDVKEEKNIKKENQIEENNTVLQNNKSLLKHIDIEDLTARLLQNPKDIEKINEIYVRRYNELCAKINECISTKEQKNIIETAHSIKGLVGMLSANNAAQYALEIETLAKNNEIDSAINKIPKLLTILQEIKSDLNQIINSMESTL